MVLPLVLPLLLKPRNWHDSSWSGSYAGGKAGENGCQWVYDKLQSEVSPELLNQPISPAMVKILNDNLAHVKSTVKELGLSWDKGLDQTVLASGGSARSAGLRDVEILTVKNGEINMAISPDRLDNVTT